MVLVKIKNGNKTMKKEYEKVEFTIWMLDADDVCTMSIASGEVEGDETKYPIPDAWVPGA